MSSVSELQGQNGFISVEAGETAGLAQSAGGYGYRAISIDADGTTITNIQGTGITVGPAFYGRTRNAGYVIYGSITSVTVGLGSVLAYNK